MAVKADDLVFVSDVQGVLIEGKVRSEIRIGEIEGFIAQGHITGGMIPKLRSAAEAVERGVSRVHICGWNGKDTIKNELNTKTSSGTVIFK
jgi:acetylglutamate kinase